MRTLILAVLVAALPASAQDTPLAITNVTVIDGTDEDPLPGRTVLVRGEKIVAISEAKALELPEETRVVDGTGKFLIPGLYDMHVHATTYPGFTELYIANGVTGVRDMFGQSPARIAALRKQITAGDRIGPDIYATGPIVDGEKPIWPGSFAATDAKKAREIVGKLKESGAAFVKVYSKLSRDAYFAIVDEAKEVGLPFAGHVPWTVTAEEASDAGQRSIEHLTGILESCMSDRSELRGKRGVARKKVLLAGYDPERAAALFARLAKNRTWQCPTLTVLRSTSHLDDPKVTRDPRIRFVPAFWKGFWDPKRDRRFQSFRAEDWKAERRVYAKSLEVVGAMHEAGVPILAGTDVANPYCFPGFSLHDELVLLVEAGLSTRAALQAATRDAARFLGEEKELGTVAAGKIANLVLLHASPLARIDNTRRIAAVVHRGRLYDEPAIAGILARADRSKKKKKKK